MRKMIALQAILLLSLATLTVLLLSGFSQASISHDIIRIESNEAFVSMANEEDWPGTGIEEDPYVILGYEIDVLEENDGFGPGIHIENTTLFFIIKDTHIFNAGISYDRPEYWGAGIILMNVTNGTLKSNRLKNNEDGIVIYNSDSIVVSNNTIYSDDDSCSTAIDVRISTNTKILNNTILGCGYGTFLWWSDEDTITGNSISDCLNGITLRDSTKNIVADNTVEDCMGDGIIVEKSTENLVANISGTFVILREPMSYQNNIRNNIITSNDGVGVYIYNSDKNTIINNSISANLEHGIYLEGCCNENSIIDNSVLTNNGSGIYLYEAQSVPQNEKSHGNIIRDNLVENNGGYGVYIDGPIDTITEDNIENGNALPQDTSKNFFDSVEVLIILVIVAFILVLLLVVQQRFKKGKRQ